MMPLFLFDYFPLLYISTLNYSFIMAYVVSVITAITWALANTFFRSALHAFRRRVAYANADCDRILVIWNILVFDVMLKNVPS